jgi:hypothetical protein
VVTTAWVGEVDERASCSRECRTTEYTCTPDVRKPGRRAGISVEEVAPRQNFTPPNAFLDDAYDDVKATRSLACGRQGPSGDLAVTDEWRRDASAPEDAAEHHLDDPVALNGYVTSCRV